MPSSETIGYALDLAQHGEQAAYAQRMHGDLRDVIEIRAQNERGDSTFRGTYTIELGAAVYVLHVFQKKSKSGIETPKRDLDLVRQRLKQAQEHYEQEKRRSGDCKSELGTSSNNSGCRIRRNVSARHA